MKLAVFAILASTAVAFTPPAMTFAVGKKAAEKKVVPAKTVAVAKKAAPKVVAKPTKAVAAKPAAKVSPFAKKAAPVAAAPTKKVAAMKVVAPKVVAKKAAPVKKVVAPKVVAPKVVAPKVVAPKVVAPKVVAKKVVAPKVVAKKAAPVKKIVVKKAPIKKIVKKAPVAKSSRATGTIPSVAIPYELAPAMLDGSLIGDVGFDPCFLSTKADTIAPYFNGIFAGDAPIDGLTWYREAELMHGRISMIAVVGFIAPGFGTFAGNEWTDSFGYTNPLEAINGAPAASLFQIFAFMSGMEFRRISIISSEGAGYTAGDSQKWGQGDGSWNPLGLNYTPAEYAEKQLQEIKHARLAMIGLLGLVFQANASGVSVVDQLSAAFVTPGYAAKAGYFLPEGI